MTGLSPQFILRKSLCRPPHCGDDDPERNHRHAELLIENLDWAPGYAEPGYSEPEKGVILTNWNYFPREVCSLLERIGYAIEWEDEWSRCSNCGKLIRITGDCYEWEPYYLVINGCEEVCLDCMSDSDWEDYLKGIEDNYRTAVPSHLDPAQYGYEQISQPNQFESGFHPHMTDDPQKILKELHDLGIRRVLFRISAKSQFSINFETWRKRDET